MSIVSWIEKLCGQKPEAHDYLSQVEGHPTFPSTGMGHSQLNEFLLSLHLDRTSEGFFEYVFKSSAIPDLEHFPGV